ncbi:MAG: NAD(P)H-dependent oxidoreductase [Nannocystaceae bacterium]|nr:NAD(P)H-dependent oxidoreductase [Nannocystaceae bacterium]
MAQRKHLIVYAHPLRDSFNGAILARAQEVLSESGDCEVLDLYAQGFDPVRSAQEQGGGELRADVLAQQEKVRWADHLVFIFPIWWFDRPAILKGWCDRVLSYGFAYQFDQASGGPVGLLQDKTASVVVTSGLIREGDEGLDWTLRSMTTGTLEFCGVANTRVQPLFCVPRASDSERAAMLVTVSDFFRTRTNEHDGDAMKEPENIESFYSDSMAKAPPAVMQWYLTLNQRDRKGLRATMTDDFTFHSPLGNFDSPAGYVDMVGKFGGWVETKRFIVEGDTVVHEFVYHMTDPGTADIPTLEIFEMRGGLIHASKVYNNPADFPSA